VRYGIGADTKSDNVFYWTTIQGIWYTGMNLRAFPFDTQQLLVQLEVPQVSCQPRACTGSPRSPAGARVQGACNAIVPSTQRAALPWPGQLRGVMQCRDTAAEQSSL